MLYNPIMYYVYILTNKSSTLYIGATNNIACGLEEHTYKVVDSFSKTYNLNKLIYIESYETLYEALLRERQLKKWRRDKKLALIKTMNPKFEDLALTLIL